MEKSTKVPEWYVKVKFMAMKKNNTSKHKIYERNPNTGVIRWRYVGESPDKFGWPNYGRILKEKKMRSQIVEAVRKHGAEGHIEKHKTNVEVFMQKPVGIGEHGDILTEIEKELKVIAGMMTNYKCR